MHEATQMAAAPRYGLLLTKQFSEMAMLGTALIR